VPLKVWIPTQLRSLTDGKTEVEVKGATVDDVILDLDRQFPGFRDRLLDEQGEVRPFLSVCVNDEEIRYLQSGKTPLKDGDEVSIIPAVAGG
jgi:molybdopterin synthase sulfur carrier subunit